MFSLVDVCVEFVNSRLKFCRLFKRSSSDFNVLRFGYYSGFEVVFCVDCVFLVDSCCHIRKFRYNENSLKRLARAVEKIGGCVNELNTLLFSRLGGWFIVDDDVLSLYDVGFGKVLVAVEYYWWSDDGRFYVNVDGNRFAGGVNDVVDFVVGVIDDRR